MILQKSGRETFRATAWGAIAVALVATGCASNEAMVKRALGAPENGGIAVLRAVLNADYKENQVFEDLKRQLTIGEARLPQSGSLLADIRRDGDDRARAGTPFEGLIVFPDLEPGTYVLRSLEQPREIIEHFSDWQLVNNRKEYQLDLIMRPIMFEVRPGQPTYVGTIELTVYYDMNVLEDAKRIELEPDEFHARLTRGRVDEIDAWSALLRRGPQSPWAPVLRERMERLRAQPMITNP